MTQRLEQLHAILNQARAEVRRVIIGQDEALDQALVVVLTNQHGLIEGVPGVAKTLLAKTLSRVLGCDFARIQFTPDLMPSDITGTNVFDLERRDFKLIEGPIFTSFLLADEINRAPAKTQSALLEAMQERSVTIDRITHKLSPDFTVFATQNPIEYEGTYPLPEAQKDRFLLKINITFPSRDAELELASRMLNGESPEQVLARGDVKPVLDPGQLSSARDALADVDMRPELMGYVVDLVRRSRAEESLLVGAGPRATQALLSASRAHAVLAQRDFVTPDDVKAMAAGVLTHRFIVRPEYEIEGITAGEVVNKLLQAVAVPL